MEFSLSILVIIIMNKKKYVKSVFKKRRITKTFFGRSR